MPETPTAPDRVEALLVNVDGMKVPAKCCGWCSREGKRATIWCAATIC